MPVEPSKIPAFKKVQYEFTAHLRDPSRNSAPEGIEDRRMKIYRGLLYRNVQNFIKSAFPVLRRLYSDKDWHRMVRDFFANHRSASPYFKDISREFLDYLENERMPRPEDPVFINELAHYEWIEICLANSDLEPDMTNVDPTGDLIHNVPVLSPLAEFFGYHFPVHKIGPDFQPKQTSAQPVFLMIYRDRQGKVGFMELNSITAKLIEQMKNNQLETGKQLLGKIAKELQHPNPEVVIRSGGKTLKQLRAKDILLGTRTQN
ncbi:MAG: DUF2063 domain-containing protein [Proteobacteria bacterium]|nr:DUF2063 domain-containing protein [Pseudomonadota bacterium]